MSNTIDQITNWRQVRDNKVHNKIVSELRDVSEEDSYKSIERLVAIDLYSALVIARRVFKRRQSSEQLFRFGMTVADASTIRDFLEFGVAKMGLKKTLRILEEWVGQETEAVDGAMYWLQALGKSKDDRELISKTIAKFSDYKTKKAEEERPKGGRVRRPLR